MSTLASSANSLFVVLFFLLSSFDVFAADSRREFFPPPGSTVADQALLQKKIEKLITLLDAKTWKERSKAGERILSVLAENPHTLRFFLLETESSAEPEIRFQGKRVLKLYFEKHVYDPKRKLGFIGISLSAGGTYVFKDVVYRPIRVVFAQTGFPGEKAGVKACDLILAVDGRICSRDFSVEEFVDYISSKSPGDVVKLKMVSRGKEVTRQVVLTERPEDRGTPNVRKSESDEFSAWLESLRKLRLGRLKR